LAEIVARYMLAWLTSLTRFPRRQSGGYVIPVTLGWGPVTIRFVDTIRYAMTYLDVFTVMLIMMGNVKLDVSDDQCIDGSHRVWDYSDDGCELGCGEDDRCFAAVSASGAPTQLGVGIR
jgi:hypothetical protein